MDTSKRISAMRRKLIRVQAERDAWLLGYEVTGDEQALRTATVYGNIVRRLRAKIFSMQN